VQSQDIKALLLRDGLEAVGNSPREFGQIIKAEIAKWHKVAKVANIQAQ
jgi:tripartite-type tricarboxylate transporter receptor subunit TctC